MRSSIPAVLLTLALSTGAFAQNIDAYREQFEDRLHTQGDSFALCTNTTSMASGFETALAEAIGATLLTQVKVVPINPLAYPQTLDTALSYTADQIYILMAEQCDGFMGFVLASGYPEWLSITPPYLVSDNVLVAKDEKYRSLQDVGTDLPIGSRMATDGDTSLLAYLQSLPESSRWKRFPYGDNQLLYDRLLDGTVGAAMIWEPALDFATKGDPAAAGLHILSTPFNVNKTQIGIAVRSNDSYLKSELGDAIRALVADGTIDKLLRQFNMATASSTPQTVQNP